MGFSDSFVELVKEIYSDATTTVKISQSDETDPININAGVKQGCPISPILFNLSTELLIRSVLSKCDENSDIPYRIHNQPISILAYADDSVLISRTKEGLQDILDVVSRAADVLSLTFRPDKCCSLSNTCAKKKQSRVGNNTFSVQEQEIPFLSCNETYRYLGVPIGLIYDASGMIDITERLTKDLEKIRDSLLAPWQKLDSSRTFIQPSLIYAFRACPVYSCPEYRKKLIDVLLSYCNRPSRSSVSYFFADKSVGGLGQQDPYDERLLQKVVHTIKILSSNDTILSVEYTAVFTVIQENKKLMILSLLLQKVILRIMLELIMETCYGHNVETRLGL